MRFSYQIDPFLCLVEDSKLEAVNSLSNHQTRVYGSKEDDDSALKSLSAVELTDSQSKESMVSMIVNSIRDLPDVMSPKNPVYDYFLYFEFLAYICTYHMYPSNI